MDISEIAQIVTGIATLMVAVCSCFAIKKTKSTIRYSK